MADDPPFDAEAYLAANPDIRARGFDPAEHYRHFGRAESRPLAPGPGVPAPAAPGEEEPFVPADLPDFDETLDRPGWFDAAYYRSQNADVASAAIDPFTHYLAHGIREGRPPNRVIGRFGRSLAVRGRLAEERAIVAGSGLFDVAWYADTYRVRKERAVAHYVGMGAFLGTDPSLFFSSLDYIAANPDILPAGVNPLVHYVTFGFRENREGVRTLSETRLTARVWLKGL